MTANGQAYSAIAAATFTGGSVRRASGVTTPHSAHGAPEGMPASECPHSSHRTVARYRIATNIGHARSVIRLLPGLP